MEIEDGALARERSEPATQAGGWSGERKWRDRGGVAGGALAPLASVRQRRLAEAQIGVGPEELRAELERQLKLQGQTPPGE